MVGADPKGAPSQRLGRHALPLPLPQHSPEAVPVVQLALHQVPLHQVHPLSTGCACAAGGLLLALLRQAVWGEVITLRGMGNGYQPCCSWLTPSPPITVMSLKCASSSLVPTQEGQSPQSDRGQDAVAFSHMRTPKPREG